MKPRTRILGVGSPFGDDRLGWVAVELIRASAWYRSHPAGALSAESFDRPGASLLAAMKGASHVIVIDGVQSGAPPGTLRTVERDQLAPTAAHPASGHTFGLADTLSLGQAVELLPPRLTLIAVELGSAKSDDALSDEVRAALPALLDCVEACVTDEEARPAFPPPREDGRADATTHEGRQPSVGDDAQP